MKIAQKINSVPLGPVTEPKGFKLDMHGLEHEIDQKVNGIDQIVNGIDQIVSDHLLDLKLPNIERSQKLEI